jgi:hypothetical protein
MKKYLKIVLPVVIVLILGFVFWQVKTNRSAIKNQGQEEAQKVSAVLKIGGANPQSFDISDFVGKTALEATESKTEVVTKGTGANAYITSINGQEADAQKREFWEFDANGSQAQVGAGSYTIQNNDEIQWKISNY